MRFGDLNSGSIIDGGAREVTELEIVEFAKRFDPQPFHVDPARARASRWGGLIGSGWMTCSIAMELAVRHVLAGSESIGSPGVENLEWPHPVRPGDRLQLTITVLESNVSRSGRTGIVRWRWELRNQFAAVVLKMVAVSLFDISASAR
jgi:acyl dehydratase